MDSMDSMDRWSKFLKEVEGTEFPYQIYCDMDGVLVNFEDGVIEYVNGRLKNMEDGDKYQRKLINALDKLGREYEITLTDISFDKALRLNAARNYMYKMVGKNREFWANLDWLPEGKKLWDYIKKYDPIICTAPMSDEGAEGKIDWIEKNLGLNRSRVILTSDKFEHASESNLLIDDMLKFLEPWIDAGGKGIHHQSTEETIRRLERVGSEALSRNK
tara:strand:- start:5612 stop:6262 length:651 start_codon:yes stop_codon:yes gene_type:complete